MMMLCRTTGAARLVAAGQHADGDVAAKEKRVEAQLGLHDHAAGGAHRACRRRGRRYIVCPTLLRYLSY
jgi:hypothetical protein